jgi:fumarate reductase subunit C
MKSFLEPTVDAQPGLQRWPAWLDLAQSLTGLALAAFMWVHLTLVSSVHFGKGTMNTIAGFFELKFLHNWERGYPIVVVLLGIAIFALFILHAGIAMRKFPASWREYRILNQQMGMMKHADTNLWFVQAVTGFIMFFFGSIHLYTMISQASNINADAAGDRFVTGHLWPMYLILHLSVGLHLVVGMYRLAVKWGPFDGKNPRKTRKVLKQLRNVLTVFYLVIGLMTVYEYMKIGYENRAHRGVGIPHASSGLAEGGSSGASTAPSEGGDAR